MKRVLIKIFIFPWKLAHHSNLADILVFFSLWFMAFVILSCIFYLIFRLIFPIDISVVLTFISSFIESSAFMIIYPMIADPLYDKEIWNNEV